jgi:hypothetical protein
MRVDRVVDRYGNSLTPGVKQIWAVDQGSGGHRLTHATRGGAWPAATRARRCSDGERRCKRYTALGCTDSCWIFTRMCSGARRALRWPTGAARGTLDGGRRGDAAAELR